MMTTEHIFSLLRMMLWSRCAAEQKKPQKMLTELDSEKGIGLIERVKQGQGKPAIIYLKKFYELEDTARSTKLSEIGKSRLSRIRKSRLSKIEKQDFREIRKVKTSGIEKQTFEKSKVRTFGNRKSRVSKIEM